MRTITGKIILPPNAPGVKAGQVLIEVRDVSMSDAPSKVIAEQTLENVRLKPGGKIKFKIPVPEVEANRTLSLRVHLSVHRGDRVQSGDLLTTTYIPVPNTGTSGPIEIPVVVI
ncbi:MAG: YbaY family lipoprotein [Chloroflexia bacterium]